MFWQIILDGFENLSGPPLSDFIVSVARNARLGFVSLMYFEGVGNLGPIGRFEGEGFVRVEEFAPTVSCLIQVEWASLVFSKTGLEKHDYDDFETRFARLLAEGLTVVRCVDAQYVYIYTGDDVVKDYICRHYEWQELGKLVPQSFEWPG